MHQVGAHQVGAGAPLWCRRYPCCASGKPCQVEIFEVPRAPVENLVKWKSLRFLLRPLYSAKPLCVKCIFSGTQQIKKFRFEKIFWFVYNLFIDDKECLMTDREFFQLDQLQWYQDFVDAEVSEIQTDTNPHQEIFEFDDVPF